ncbi:MAG: PEGA domain-containing protein [Deltaproteobacteria bacterium]|nr:PEGA domain-containing protein [Deltaproteobacteria bacterium]
MLLLPPPATAPQVQRLLADSVAACLRQSARLGLVPEDRFRTALAAPPRHVRSDELRREVDESLGRVREHYRRLAVEDALRLLQEVENARLNALACPESAELAAQLSFWMGVVQAATQDPGRARERFLSSLFVDARRPIDAAYFPPETVALFEKVRADLGATPTGAISLTSDPDGAEVYLDGRRAGLTPLTVNAPEGYHLLCVRRIGSRDWAARVRIAAGRVETQRVFLVHAASSELASQLVALLAGSGSVDFANPAHIEAVGAAVGADVVVRVMPAGGLEYRRVARPAELRRVAGPAATAGAERVAEAVVAQLENELAPPPPPPPAPAAGQPRAVDLELWLSGSVAAAAGTGALGGMSVGLRIALRRSLALAVRLGFAAPGASVALVDPAVDTQVALVEGSFEIPGKIELRWTPFERRSWRPFAALGLDVRYGAFSAPRFTLPLGSAAIFTPLPTDLGSRSALLIGPAAGLGAAVALGRKWDLVMSLGYALDFYVAGPKANTLFRLKDDPPTSQRPVTLEPGQARRHVVTFEAGIARRLD